MIRIGVLSDTHLPSITESFALSCKKAFDGCHAIIHAGDLTSLSILKVFKGREIIAVSGNMCDQTTKMTLPDEKRITLGGYTFGICHGAGDRYTIEDRMLDLFPDVDCIVFGHTHQPVAKRIGRTLLVNPGGFCGTGPHGAQGTYIIITIDENGHSAIIHTLDP